MRFGLLATVLMIGASCLATAQQSDKTHAAISRTLDGMSSSKWRDRKKAFNEMPSLAAVNKQDAREADRLKVGLIHLLLVENAESSVAASETEASSESETEERDEEYSDYLANLIGVVAGLNDERAIPALLGAIASGGMATEAIARFGEKAIGPLLDQLHNSDGMVRSSVLFTIRDLIEMHIPLAPTSQARIRDVLHSSLTDPDEGVRDGAMAAIEYIDNREEFVPALEKIAQNDPVKLPGVPDDGGDNGQFYPLRQNARRLLRKIANHEPPVIDRGINP